MAEALKPGAARLLSQVPFSTRLRYAFFAYLLFALNKLVHRGVGLYGWVKPSANGPSQVKRYGCRPSLNVHVFLPKSFDAAAHPKAKLPTLLTIHGGGFVLGNPEDNDLWNHEFANRYGVLVIGLDYSKGPVHPFPKAIHDLEALALAVLADSSLPIDTSRVALGGWSAGGNLTLAVASLPSLKGRIHAIVPVYPATDFTVAAPAKALTRQYKTFDGFRGRKTDYLLRLAPIFNWAYLPPMKDRSGLANPLLSPEYQSREALPPYIFVVGCELDLLCMEAYRMISRLAGRPEPQVAVVGRETVAPPGELIVDDERFAFETRSENSSYKWLLIPDALHGFDQGMERMFGKNDPVIADALVKKKKSQDLIAEWLFKGPFAKPAL